MFRVAQAVGCAARALNAAFDFDELAGGFDGAGHGITNDE
jgi:hypothetical protein